MAKLANIGARVFLCLALAAGLAGCREGQWNPKVAVLVDGRPIATEALDKILELGFHPPVAEGGEGGADTLSVGQILAHLIDENIILAEAAKAGLSVSDKELAEATDSLASAWFDATPPPSELGEMQEALRRQLLSRKMAERVMRENSAPSAERWHEFWAGWPRAAHARYLARLLVVPPTAQEPKLPPAAAKTLGDMVEWFADRGQSALVTDAVWLDSRKLTAEEASALETALRKKRPTKPFRQPESWIVYEPLEKDPGLTEADSLLAAKAAFEELEGEKAFHRWLTERRGRADIKMNPAYAQGAAEPVEQ